jgi:small subunit ribosomal protein S13
LVAKNADFRFVNFLGVDYKSTLSIKLILKSILGISFFGLKLVCQQFNISQRLPLVLFNGAQLVELKSLLFSSSFFSFNFKRSSNYLVGDFYKKAAKEYLIEIRQTGFLRALRFRKGLPVRGQRTKTNARTCRRV